VIGQAVLRRGGYLPCAAALAKPRSAAESGVAWDDALLAPEISFGGLYRHMAQEKLDLLKFAPSRVA
jgi:hypothetical protein